MLTIMAATSAASEPKRLVKVHYICEEATAKKMKLYHSETTIQDIYLEHNISECSLTKVEMMESPAKWFDVDRNLWFFFFK